jgi:hypothetical protein
VQLTEPVFEVARIEVAIGVGRMSDGPVLPGVKINLKVPEDVTRDTLTFAKRILGPLAEIGDLFSDKVRFLRFKSAAKTLNRAAEIAKENGFSPSTIPMKFLKGSGAAGEYPEDGVFNHWRQTFCGGRTATF